ncbi:hypothetical protein F0L68_13650 [Solihabitans fulvus]|uniref:SAM-dependent methyltransferase, MidA family n=1 Tax=Solihabitans fulvus TaxID=1892852 RepID=A0A5B2XG42_9PSEU|nr:SAM-dependent methyltransferase [Solihabitans fulvus]KAA2262313.1 hypothetical protein F0L68_13650 [Solihabitans fulvus]
MRDWREAWQAALYGPGGFFARGEQPSAHFRTAPVIGRELAEALVELLGRVDTALDHPAALDFVDVGAGGGELAQAVRESAGGDLGRRLRVTAVELAPARPTEGVRWRRDLPERVVGLLVGHEWLDAVPCRVATVHNGLLLPVLVDTQGNEAPSGSLTEAEGDWLARWWPLAGEGARAEVGSTRDAVWATAVAGVAAGAALAVDYGHLAADRAAGRFPDGTLTGYLAGRQVAPLPDGSRDLTAHVALDACAEAVGTGADTVLVAQHAALAALGMSGGSPAAALAATDPLAWLAASARAGRIAELRARDGLGRFGWLLHATGGVRATDLLPSLPAWQP